MLVLTFIGLPFVVRTVQPVLQSLDAEVEEAAASLGATRWQSFRRVILPMLYPALLTGFALAFARAWENTDRSFSCPATSYMSDLPGESTEIAPQLIVEAIVSPGDDGISRAAAIAVVLLIASFGMLVLINLLERWSKRNVA